MRSASRGVRATELVGVGRVCGSSGGWDRWDGSDAVAAVSCEEWWGDAVGGAVRLALGAVVAKEKAVARLSMLPGGRTVA